MAIQTNTIRQVQPLQTLTSTTTTIMVVVVMDMEVDMVDLVALTPTTIIPAVIPVVVRLVSFWDILLPK